MVGVSRPVKRSGETRRRPQELGELAPRGSFRFEQVLRYQVRQASEPVERDYGGRYRRVLALPGGPALVEAGADDPVRTRLLRVRSLSRRLDASESELALGQIRAIYSLDFPVPAFERHVRRDPVLASVVRRLRGLRVACIPDPFESLVWSILGQQISLIVAMRLKQRLVAAAGETVSHAGAEYHAFPKPQALARWTEPRLLSLGLSRPKARYVRNVSGLAAAGELDLEGLRTLTPEARRERLLEVTGIGPWTASYVALRSYGEADAFPLADVGLEVAASAEYGTPERLRGPALAALAEGWRPYRGWVTFYLWCTRLLAQDGTGRGSKPGRDE